MSDDGVNKPFELDAHTIIANALPSQHRERHAVASDVLAALKNNNYEIRKIEVDKKPDCQGCDAEPPDTEGFPINELALPEHLRTPKLDYLREDAATAWCSAHRWHFRKVDVEVAVTAQVRYSMALAERFMWEHGGPRYTDGPRTLCEVCKHPSHDQDCPYLVVGSIPCGHPNGAR